MNKYIGKVYEGRWEVVRFEPYGKSHNHNSGRYVLRNIYNENEIFFKDATLRRIDREEITISKLQSKKLKRNMRREGRKVFNW
jgi:hypothetical protein